MDIAVVIPTYNEAANVGELVDRLELVLAGQRWEVIFVDDDSPDGTHERVRALAFQRPHVRCIQRIGRRGLSRAVVEGMLSTSASRIAVLDADLQHDEALLPAMFEQLSEPAVDVVVGSRYMDAKGAEALAPRRLAMSKLANRLADLVLDVKISDPMSGYFAIKREVFVASVRRLSGEGYKILLDILASAPRPLRVVELPYTFRPRRHGQSKLDSAVVWEFMMLLIDKRVGHYVPARFVMFAAVGATGVLVHMAILWALHRQLGWSFPDAQALATGAAMTTNFALNNQVTYRDRRKRGWGWLGGLLSFYLVCGLGAVANVGVASALFDRQQGWVVAAAAGALVGTVWNYMVNSAITWRQR